MWCGVVCGLVCGGVCDVVCVRRFPGLRTAGLRNCAATARCACRAVAGIGSFFRPGSIFGAPRPKLFGPWPQTPPTNEIAPRPKRFFSPGNIFSVIGPSFSVLGQARRRARAPARKRAHAQARVSAYGACGRVQARAQVRRRARMRTQARAHVGARAHKRARKHVCVQKQEGCARPGGGRAHAGKQVWPN